MSKPKLKDDQIHLKVTTSQKKQLKNLADLNKKTLSEYMLDAGLSLTLDTAKMDFYQSINSDLKYLKKNMFILTRLMLLIGSEQLKSQDTILSFYRDSQEDADKLFGKD